MAGPEDDKVTDLRRYRREREKAAAKPAPKAAPKAVTGGGFIGSNPRAGLILALVALVMLALYVVPALL